jgi:hypothetical protein
MLNKKQVLEIEGFCKKYKINPSIDNLIKMVIIKERENTMEPEVKNAGMKCQKIERQAFFYLIENCSSCGLDHEIYEGDLHFLINSIDGNLAFTCPHDHTYVEIGVV